MTELDLVPRSPDDDPDLKHLRLSAQRAYSWGTSASTSALSRLAIEDKPSFSMHWWNRWHRIRSAKTWEMPRLM
jgi:hypothetical protein